VPSLRCMVMGLGALAFNEWDTLNQEKELHEVDFEDVRSFRCDGVYACLVRYHCACRPGRRFLYLERCSSSPRLRLSDDGGLSRRRWRHRRYLLAERLVEEHERLDGAPAEAAAVAQDACQALIGITGFESCGLRI